MQPKTCGKNGAFLNYSIRILIEIKHILKTEVCVHNHFSQGTE